MSCLEISTGQSSFLPRRLWIRFPEMPLTLRPSPPGLPWAVDLNLALISSDQGHPSSLAFPVCCPVCKEQLCSSLIPLQKLQQLPMTMTTMTVTIQRTKSKLRSLVFMWPQHLPRWSPTGLPSSSHTGPHGSLRGAGPPSSVLGSHQLSLSKFKPSLRDKLVNGKSRL